MLIFAGTLTTDQNEFSHNAATGGGGLVVCGGSAVVANSSFLANTGRSDPEDFVGVYVVAPGTSGCSGGSFTQSNSSFSS